MIYRYQSLLDGIVLLNNLTGWPYAATTPSTEGLRTWATQCVKWPTFQRFHLSHLTRL